MFNHVNTRRTRNAIIGLVLAGSAVVGTAGVVGAASDGDAVSDGNTDADVTETVGLVAAHDSNADPVDRAERAAHREARREAREETRTEVAALLELDVDELGDRLRSGSTLAEVAAEQGVEVSSVVDLIVEHMTERLDAAVADGRITQERADERAAELVDRVQTRVEDGRPERGDHGPRGRHGDGGLRGDHGDRGPRPESNAVGEVAPADGEG